MGGARESKGEGTSCLRRILPWWVAGGSSRTYLPRKNHNLKFRLKTILDKTGRQRSSGSGRESSACSILMRPVALPPFPDVLGGSCVDSAGEVPFGTSFRLEN